MSEQEWKFQFILIYLKRKLQVIDNAFKKNCRIDSKSECAICRAGNNVNGKFLFQQKDFQCPIRRKEKRLKRKIIKHR